MAQKKKDTQGSGAADALEAVRSAIERTLQVTTEGATGTQKRTRDLVDEVSGAAARVRETIELLEDVRGLRAEVQDLSRRVAELELRDGGTTSAPSKPAAKSKSTKSTASRTKPRSSSSAKKS